MASPGGANYDIILNLLTINIFQIDTLLLLFCQLLSLLEPSRMNTLYGLYILLKAAETELSKLTIDIFRIFHIDTLLAFVSIISSY